MANIYKLVDPRNNAVRYVGKSVAPRARLLQHIANHDGNEAKSQWLNELKSVGLYPVLCMVESSIEGRYEACAREQYWIQFYLEQGEPLTNIMFNSHPSRCVNGEVSNVLAVGSMLMSQSNGPISNEEWVPLTQAAGDIGISAAKLSRMAKEGRVKTQKDPYDERKTLVDLVELRKIFPKRR